MDLNSILPAFVPAVIGLVVVSIAAVLVLVWNKRPDVQRLVRRIWLVAVICIVAGLLIFWIATVLVGSGRPTLDRSLQQRQQNELDQRLRSGGH